MRVEQRLFRLAEVDGARAFAWELLRIGRLRVLRVLGRGLRLVEGRSGIAGLLRAFAARCGCVGVMLAVPTVLGQRRQLGPHGRLLRRLSN